MTFPEADEPWVPTLVEVERLKSLDTDDSPVDWRQYGWSALEQPDDCPHVYARFDILGERFLERYAFRMLNSETMERWQTRLQNRFDEIVHPMERAYAMYEANADAMQTLSGTSTVSKGNSKADSTSEGESKDYFSETPDTSVNDWTDASKYAGNVRTAKNSSKQGTTTEDGRTTTQTWTGSKTVTDINDNLDAYRDLDTMFVAQFENLFMNLWWY